MKPGFHSKAIACVACVACVDKRKPQETQALSFLAVFVYATHATHATQAIAFEWKPDLSCNVQRTLQLVVQRVLELDKLSLHAAAFSPLSTQFQ